MATWTIFDFGKRERLVGERRTQVQMAEGNIELVRAKVAADVKKSYLDLQKARRLYQLTQQVASLYERVPAGDGQAEADMLQADLDYRLVHAQFVRAVSGQ